jgi:hypothetical protein
MLPMVPELLNSSRNHREAGVEDPMYNFVNRYNRINTSIQDIRNPSYPQLKQASPPHGKPPSSINSARARIYGGQDRKEPRFRN